MMMTRRSSVTRKTTPLRHVGVLNAILALSNHHSCFSGFNTLWCPEQPQLPSVPLLHVTLSKTAAGAPAKPKWLGWLLHERPSATHAERDALRRVNLGTAARRQPEWSHTSHITADLHNRAQSALRLS